MATPNQGIKFRRISNNKNQSRSASTGNILSSSPPSYPEVTAYDALMRSATMEQSNTQSNSSSRQGGSFAHLLERQRVGGVVGLSAAYSMNGTTASLDSDNLNNYRDTSSSATRSRSHAHHTHSQSYSGGAAILRGSGGGSSGGTHQHKRHSLQSPPSQAPTSSTRRALDSFSSRDSSHSGREVGSYTRHSHNRDSASQDTVGERDFDYRYRYNANNSSTLPTLSLQDSYHRDHSRAIEQSSRGRGRTRLSDDFDLRRNVQEIDIMPIHEAFSHEAMVSASGGGLGVPAHHSPHSQNPLSPEGSSRGGGGGAVIDHQPLATTAESQRMQSPPDNPHEGSSGDVQPPRPHNFYPVFFSPESGRLFMSVDGSYTPLPDEYYNPGPNMQPGENFNQAESSGRQTSSSYGISAPYDYYHCSIVMMLLYIVCLNLVAVLLFSIPALWFARKAMQAKYEGDYAGTLSLGTRALCFNIIGGFVHVLFLGTLTFLPILLKFVFDVI